jgi:protein-S-isoprenylcysteine O-methyltransferase Ste14
MNRKKILPPTYCLICLIAMPVLHLLAPGVQIITPPWNLSGIVPIILGVILSIQAENLFVKVGTTVNPFESSTALVTDGLFRISRNPMYLGMAMILAGVGMLLGSVIPLMIVPVFVGLITLKFIKVEERMMADDFGQEWLDYKAKVRRWI